MPQPLVTPWPDKYQTGWDGTANVPPCHEPVPLDVALQRAYETDSHVWPGVVLQAGNPIPAPRIKKESLGLVRKAGLEVRLTTILLDLDDPIAHEQGIPARADWRAAQLPMLETVPWYETKGGYRVVLPLEHPLEPEEYERAVVKLIEDLAQGGLLLDDACKDWTHCYRLPFVRRGGKDQRGHLVLPATAYRVVVPPPRAPTDRRLGAARAPTSLPRAIREGQHRNKTLFNYGASRRAAGLDEDELRALLELANGRCYEPIPDAELEHIWKQVCGYEQGTIRDVVVYPPAPKVALDIQYRAADLVRMVGEAERALGQADVYSRGGRLVEVVPAPDGSLAIHPIGASALRLHAARAANWQSFQQKGDAGSWVAIAPPQDVIGPLFDKGYWPNIPSLQGVTDVPILRASGTVHQQEGYDEESQYVYRPTSEIPPIPTYPTRSDAEEALGVLEELLVDFPFASEVDRAAALALLLSGIARPACPLCPLFVVDGHTPSSGKSYLFEVATMLSTGRDVETTAEVEEEELEKRITSLLMKGARAVLIDNVTKPVGGSALDAVLTSSTWQGRFLGKTEMLSLSNSAVWCVTGNNVAVRGDVVRRAIRVYLDTPEERPERRADYRYPDLLGHVREHRGELVRAALTVIRAYEVAGRPAAGHVAPMGSFGAWSRFVREPLVWLGHEDCAVTQEMLREASDEGLTNLAELLVAWHAVFGADPQSVRELLETCALKSGQPKFARLGRAIEELCGLDMSDRKIGQKLGWTLRGRRNRQVAGLKVVRADPTRGRDGVRYAVVPAGAPG